MRKIKSVREVVLSVREFFLLEKKHLGPIIPVNNVMARVSAATGFTVRCIRNFMHEAKLVEENGGEEIIKTRKPRTDKIVIDEHGKEVLRRKIQEFNMKREKITIVKLVEALKQEIDFKGGKDVLRRILGKMGYRFENVQSRYPTLIECPDKVETETKCNHEQPSPGNSGTGTTPNYSSPKPTPSSSYIIPGLKPPNSNSKKEYMYKWLRIHDVNFAPDLTRTQLLELVQRHAWHKVNEASLNPSTDTPTEFTNKPDIRNIVDEEENDSQEIKLEIEFDAEHDIKIETEFDSTEMASNI